MKYLTGNLSAFRFDMLQGKVQIWGWEKICSLPHIWKWQTSQVLGFSGESARSRGGSGGIYVSNGGTKWWRNIRKIWSVITLVSRIAGPFGLSQDMMIILSSHFCFDNMINVISWSCWIIWFFPRYWVFFFSSSSSSSSLPWLVVCKRLPMFLSVSETTSHPPRRSIESNVNFCNHSCMQYYLTVSLPRSVKMTRDSGAAEGNRVNVGAVE